MYPRQTYPIKTCDVCGKQFPVPPSTIKWDKIRKHKNSFCSHECHDKFQKIAKLGKKNPMWVGDKIKYNPLHIYIRRHFPNPYYCDNCGKTKNLDLANVSGKYKRDLTDWVWLCRKCHMVKDGRLEKLHGPMSVETKLKIGQSNKGGWSGSKNPNFGGKLVAGKELE